MMTLYSYQLTMPETEEKLAELNTNEILTREPVGRDWFSRTFMHDLDRLIIVHFGSDLQTIKDQLSNSEHFEIGEEESSYRYKQGDLQGALATTLVNSKKTEAASLDNNHIEFVFRNELGQLCNFNLAYIKNGEDYHLIVAITENINKEPENRKITLLIDDYFFPEHSETLKAKGDALDINTLSTHIETALQSQEINSLIMPVINPLPFNQAEFNKLNNRFKPGTNIDNREFKIRQLDEILQLAGNINTQKNNPDLNRLIAKIQNNKQGNQEFQDSRFEQLLAEYALQLEQCIMLIYASEAKRKQLIQLNCLLYTRQKLERDLTHNIRDYDKAKINCINRNFEELSNQDVPEEPLRGEKSLSEKKAYYESTSFAQRNKKSLIVTGVAGGAAITLGIIGAVLISTGVLAPTGILVMIGAGVLAGLVLTFGAAFVNIFAKETKIVADLNRLRIKKEEFIDMTNQRVNALIPESAITQEMKRNSENQPAITYILRSPPPQPDITINESDEDEMQHELLTGFTDAAFALSKVDNAVGLAQKPEHNQPKADAPSPTPTHSSSKVM